jgi:hypothetical protein
MKYVNTTTRNANDRDAVSLIVNLGDISKGPSEAPKEVDKEIICRDGMMETSAK